MWTRINMTYDSFPRIFKTKTKAEEVATRWKKRQPKNEPGAVIIEGFMKEKHFMDTIGING